MSKTFRAFHALHLAHMAIFRAADKSLKRQEGILTAHQSILFVLCAEDGVPSSVIARRAGMSKSRLTGLVDALETKALIRRQRGEKDARQQLLFIEPEGRTLIDRTKGRLTALNELMLEDFDEDERSIIQRFLHNAVTKVVSDIEMQEDNYA